MMKRGTSLLFFIILHNYRRRGGGRDRIAVDFLIGGHAAAQTERLLTRDLGFYRKYFKGLAVVSP